MEQGYNIGNIFRNTTKKQKVAGIVFLMVVVILVIILFVLVGLPQEGSDVGDDVEEVVEVEERQITLEKGITGAELMNDRNTTEEVVEVPVDTRYNKEHDYTLLEYIPAANYEYVNYGDGQTGIKDYWWVMENTAIEKGIIVSANSCDVEGNTVAANEFLKELPVNLSDYVIVYQVHEGAVPCNV